MKFTNKKMCQILGRDRRTQSDDYATGECGYVPTPEQGFRFWTADDIVAELFFLDHREDGYTVKIAGRLATRLRDGMKAHPDADQLTILRLANGSTATLPTASLDLTSGYTSGSYVRTALTIDVRNYRERVQRLIEADAEIVGAGDDDRA
jgi:hypothetical protein